jgi:hypothetical protein
VAVRCGAALSPRRAQGTALHDGELAAEARCMHAGAAPGAPWPWCKAFGKQGAQQLAELMDLCKSEGWLGRRL